MDGPFFLNSAPLIVSGNVATVNSQQFGTLINNGDFYRVEEGPCFLNSAPLIVSVNVATVNSQQFGTLINNGDFYGLRVA